MKSEDLITAVRDDRIWHFSDVARLTDDVGSLGLDFWLISRKRRE